MIGAENKLKYSNIKSAVFIERLNRFVALVNIDGKEEKIHVKNTGRCKEILIPGTQVFIEKSANPNRKTLYSLISAIKGDRIINIDSQAPNSIVYEAIKDRRIKEFKTINNILREKTYLHSRFDLFFECNGSKGFIEVKGVTLETNGVALFPDAPTQRGTKHLEELIIAKENGYLAFIFFLVQMKGVDYFAPNSKMDPDFSKALLNAVEKGVHILSYDCYVKEDEIILADPVPVVL